MAALVCDICGGKLVMQSGGVAKCDSCGMEYTKERIQEKVQEIKGTVKIDGPVETVKGDAEKERLLNMANDCLNKGNLVEAKRIYTTVSKEYSNDWRGWWGIICSTPLSKDMVIAPSPYYPARLDEGLLEYEFNMALSFAPDVEKNNINNYKNKRLTDIEKIKSEHQLFLKTSDIDSQIKYIKNDTNELENQIKELQNKQNHYEDKINSNNKVNVGFTVTYFVIILIFLLIPSLSNWWLLLIVPVGAVVLFGMYFGDSDIRLTKEFKEKDKKHIELLKSKIIENDNKVKTLLSEKEKLN